MPTPQDYIDQAINSGIPMDVIERFLTSNPGDEHRLLSSLGDEIYSAQYPQGRSIEDYPGAVFTPAPIVSSNQAANVLDSVYVDRDTIATIPTTSGAPMVGTEGFKDILGKIISVLPFPGAGAIGGIISGGDPSQFAPGPGGQVKLPMPSAPTLPAPRVPEVLPPSVRVPRAPRAPSPAGMAKIAAAAAALGITAEEYIRRYGYNLPGGGTATGGRKRMNVTNVRALRRASRRVEGFACLAKRLIKFTDNTRIKGVRRGCSKKRKCA